MIYTPGHNYPGKGTYIGTDSRGKRHQFRRTWNVFTIGIPWYHYEPVKAQPDKPP